MTRRALGPGGTGQVPRDSQFRTGAATLLSDYARLTANRSVVLVYDPVVANVSTAIAHAAERLRIRVRSLSAEREWPDIAAELAAGPDAVLFLESGESHHTQAVLRDLACHPRRRTYRLFGATPETIRRGFRRTPGTLRRRNLNLILRARWAGSLYVESGRGTRLRVGFDAARPWTSTYGECADGFPGILPPSEVNTRSADVDGVLVADGAVGSNIGWPLDARLAASPVCLRIVRGRVADVTCRRRQVRDLVEEFLRVPGCDEVVEIGIGTNDGIRSFVPSDVLLNERVAGFHIGIGSADAPRAEQNLHLDFMVRECRVALGAHIVLSDGTFAATAPRGVDRGNVAITLHDAL